MQLQVPAYFHTLFEIAAFFFGFRYYLWLRKKKGDTIPEMNRIWIIAGATIGALIGSRLTGAFENPALLGFHSLKNSFAALNSKSIVGGLIGGTWGVELVKKIIGEKQRSGDLFVFPILLALLIGRIGCLLTALNDHTAGGPTTLPWGIDYGDGVRRHPLPLYEMIFLAICFLVFQQLSRKNILKEGSLFKLMMVSYLLYRLGNELLKDDYIYSWGLTSIQTSCMAGLIYYYKVFIHPRHLFKADA